jgi:hypothetical protein
MNKNVFHCTRTCTGQKTQCFQADVKRYKCSYLKVRQLHQSPIKMTEERKKSEVKNEVWNVERKEESRLAKMNVYVVEERKCILIFYSRGLIKRVTWEYSKTCAATEMEKEEASLDILIFVNNWWLCDIFLLDILVYSICYTSFLKVLIS